MKGGILGGGAGLPLFLPTKMMNKHLLPMGMAPVTCHPFMSRFLDEAIRRRLNSNLMLGRKMTLVELTHTWSKVGAREKSR